MTDDSTLNAVSDVRFVIRIDSNRLIIKLKLERRHPRAVVRWNAAIFELVRGFNHTLLMMLP